MRAAEASVRYRFGPFEVQPAERRVLASGAPVHLGPHAFDLLVALVERSGYLVSKDELLQRGWGKAVVAENTLQVHVSALRRILGADAIATVSGRGYRFVPEVACIRDDPIPKHNFPYQITSFIGREQEIAKIKQLLASTRLLTLTGAGGCGKTRLALQVAREVLDGYPEGGWLVELASLGDATLVPQSVANVLAVKEQAGRDLAETVAESLQSRRLLLVLDNAEHLLGACTQLADHLLRHCDQLAILVTSRERLGITGELAYRVPSLSVPDARQDAAGEEVTACEAARLFIDRARLQRPDFAVATKDAAPLASICRHLDGIALAIELAAPRVRSMSLEELSRHLDDRFGVLTGGARTAPPRHRTLRSLIDWSYDLLGDSEKTMLYRASVFAGGWTVEAAERVCCGENVHGSKVLDLLTSLADKNLVATETVDDVTRFSMLETIRHYARDRLQERGEEASVSALHLAHFLAMAEDAERQIGGTDLAASLERLDSDRDNLRSALSWSLSAGADAAAGLRLAGALAYFWWQSGTLREGRDWLSRLLAAVPEGEDAAARAKACHGAGILAQDDDDHPIAQVLAEEALSIRRQLGDQRGIRRSLTNLGLLASYQADYRTARTLLDEALTNCREANDRHATAVALGSLGTLETDHGNNVSARAFLEESLAIWRALGGWGISNVLHMLGTVAHRQGDYPEAQALLEESLAIARQDGNPMYLSDALAELGNVARSRGDHVAAVVLLKEALTIQREVGQRRRISLTLDYFAAVVLALAEPRFAARLLGGAERLLEEIKVPMTPVARTSRARLVAAARTALGDDAAFDIAWREGRTISLEQLVKHALEFDAGA